jgi:hypothetical protein
MTNEPLPDTTTINARDWCDYCGWPYDPISTRWFCTHCGMKTSCCEGAPLPPSITTEDAK